jgi:hypothetical protein
MDPADPTVTIVPCADSGRAGCAIVRRAAEIVAEANPDAALRIADECPRDTKSYLVAIDASSACQASDALRACGCRPGAVVSAAAVLARAGLVKPGVDLHARREELAQALAAAVRDSLQGVFADMRARRQYREEMAPILQRFHGIWQKLTALETPNGRADAAAAQRVELLGRRARNLFVKFDEVVPPVDWSEPHDLFQDAMLCVAYATEGWAHGDADRWQQNLQKARVQIRPLLRRLEG